jgi:hypothetical protein
LIGFSWSFHNILMPIFKAALARAANPQPPLKVHIPAVVSFDFRSPWSFRQ